MKIVNKSILKEEQEYFERNKKYYLQKYKNKFVLIKSQRFIGAYGSAEEAYSAGLRKFGNEPMFIKQVTKEEPIPFILDIV